MGEALEQRLPSSASGKSAAAFRTISEVAAELELPQHVLRFWESKFPHIRPLKRGGGRRYYRPEDVTLLRRIRDLLYSEGYTIKGVQKLLRQNGVKGEAMDGNGDDEPMAAPALAEAIPSGMSDPARRTLEGVLRELEDLRRLLRRPSS
jgi:DNA-binding transcriptional MerR regulator